MRAVRRRPWRPAKNSAMPSYGQVYRRAAPPSGGRALRPLLAFGLVFAIGYIPGVLAGRSGGFGVSALAEHYMDRQTFAAFGTVFADWFAAGFLQATLILLCGFCALGPGLLAAFFALKGMYLGYCAASVYADGGAKGLAAHWLLTALPSLGVLGALLALAAAALPLSFALLCSAFGERQPAEGLYSRSRTLILRYALTVAETALCCGLGGIVAVFLADILL